MNAEFMDVRETSKVLGVSERSVRDHIRSGDWSIPYIESGNRILIFRHRFYRDFLGYGGGLAERNDIIHTQDVTANDTNRRKAVSI